MIESLSINNFKSFIGFHDVKLNQGLTAVVGKNGSGKSNFFESICVCLGEKTKYLKDSNYFQMISRCDSYECQVKLVNEN